MLYEVITVYTISDVKLVGDMVVDEIYLRGFVLAQPGSVFNRNNFV